VFVGHWEHTIDEKGRVTLPASMREPLSPRAYVTKYDGCLAVWPSAEFEEVSALMEQRLRSGEISQKAHRAFFASATAINVDKAGRISLPAPLRTYAQLEAGGDAVLTGNRNRLEIWTPDRYVEMVGSEEGDAALADELTALGI